MHPSISDKVSHSVRVALKSPYQWEQLLWHFPPHIGYSPEPPNFSTAWIHIVQQCMKYSSGLYDFWVKDKSNWHLRQCRWLCQARRGQWWLRYWSWPQRYSFQSCHIQSPTACPYHDVDCTSLQVLTGQHICCSIAHCQASQALTGNDIPAVFRSWVSGQRACPHWRRVMHNLLPLYYIISWALIHLTLISLPATMTG